MKCEIHETVRERSLRRIYTPELPTDLQFKVNMSDLEDVRWVKSRKKLELACRDHGIDLLFCSLEGRWKEKVPFFTENI